jgi:hypothetical protein
MRRPDFSSGQCPARVREAHPPSSISAQPDPDDPPNNGDARSVHTHAQARGISHLGVGAGERHHENYHDGRRGTILNAPRRAVSRRLGGIFATRCRDR